MTTYAAAAATTAAAVAAINPLASPINDIDDPVVLQLYQDALEDVHTRFLLNLPEEELATADRILFQIEQAWWFYEDWICDQQDTTINGALPRFKGLKPFAVEMFQFSPLLDTKQFHPMWAIFCKYKRKISTYGCILLNPDCTKIILCQDWNSKSWTLPAGKINQGEDGIDAAAREVYEETGFDPNGKYGLTEHMVATWRQPLQEKDGLSYKDEIGKHRNFYICPGVPENFPFAPVARKEVASVKWHPLEKIPKKNFAVLPMLPKVRRWIKQNTNSKGNNNNNSSNKKDRQKTPKQARDKSDAQNSTPKNKRDSTNTTPLKSNKTPTSKERESKSIRKKQDSRSRSRGKGAAMIQADDPLFESGLAAVGSENRWSEEDMFEANEKILGRKIEYDGNPHVFSEQGFQGMDPHHFHVVGGAFLNSDTDQLAPPPPTSRLQHLFHAKSQDAGGGTGGGVDDNGESEFLTPFFSDEGATPWGEVVREVKDAEHKTIITSPDLTNSKTGGKSKKNKKQQQQQKKEPVSIMMAGDGDDDLVFMTDEEITSRSQKTKLAQTKASSTEEMYQQDLVDIQTWVDKLPKAQPTKEFGTFKFNVDSLMDALYQQY